MNLPNLPTCGPSRATAIDVSNHLHSVQGTYIQAHEHGSSRDSLLLLRDAGTLLNLCGESLGGRQKKLRYNDALSSHLPAFAVRGRMRGFSARSILDHLLRKGMPGAAVGGSFANSRDQTRQLFPARPQEMASCHLDHRGWPLCLGVALSTRRDHHAIRHHGSGRGAQELHRQYRLL
jgi:hypothetical protein